MSPRSLAVGQTAAPPVRGTATLRRTIVAALAAAFLVAMPDPAWSAPPPPVAQDQAVETLEDTPVQIDLTNGSPTAKNQAFAIVQQPQHGTLTGTGVTRTYTPDPNFHGEDFFTFNARRGGDVSDAARVDIVVQAVNDAPTAVDDAYSTDEDTVLNVAVPGVLANDTDVEGDSLAVVSVAGSAGAVGAPVTTPKGALVTVNANGSLSYDPSGSTALNDLHTGQSDSDSVAYQVGDSGGEVDAATLTITVAGRGSPPTATDDHFHDDEDTILNVVAPGVLANDTGSGPHTVTHLNGSTTLNGTTTLGAAITINPNGSFSYDPTGSATLQALDTGQSADDTFTYTVANTDNQTDTATVTITVAGRDD